MDLTETQTQELAGDQCCLLSEGEVGFALWVEEENMV